MSDPHLKEIRKVTPSSQGCEDCLKIGGEWVHLRLCLTCGHVGCCTSRYHKHATAHFHRPGHPVMRSHKPGEAWRWCNIAGRLLPTATIGILGCRCRPCPLS